MRPARRFALPLCPLALLFLVSFVWVPITSAQGTEPPESPEVAEVKEVDRQIARLKAQCASVEDALNAMTGPEQATKDLVDLQRNQIGGQLQSLLSVRQKLQAIIQISGLMSQFTGSVATTAENRLAQLRYDLARLRADQPKPSLQGCHDLSSTSPDTKTTTGSTIPAQNPSPSTPPSQPSQQASAAVQPTQPSGNPADTPATEHASQTPSNPGAGGGSPAQTKSGGALAGRILDDLTGAPIANASVIARCGTNGDAEYTTRTDISGFYHFDSILESLCLVRASKFLSPMEIDLGKKVGPSRRSARDLPGLTSLSSNKDVLENLNAAVALDPEPPALRSYQERTVKNLTPGTSGSATLVQDIRLTERKASIGEFARIISGFEQSGASSAPSVQKYFTDFWVSIPFPFFHTSKTLQARAADFNFGYPLRLWGDFRITSVPQQVTSSIGDFAISFADQIGAVKVNQVAQATEFMIGGEYRVAHWGVTNSRLLSFDQSTRERFALYWTSGFGRVTPLNPKDSLEIFKNPVPGTEPDFDAQIAAQGLTGKIAGKPFLAFIPDDRYKFYKEYYSGFRIKTFYYDRDTDEPLRRFPATLEASFGQNETVTGGRLHRMVARLEGFYPLPYDSVHYMYLFGTADLIMGGQKGGRAILLDPATNAPAIPDPGVFIIHSPQLDRDHYRLGVGIDFLQLVDAIKNKGKNNPVVKSPAPATPAPAPASPQTP